MKSPSGECDAARQRYLRRHNDVLLLVARELVSIRSSINTISFVNINSVTYRPLRNVVNHLRTVNRQTIDIVYTC